MRNEAILMRINICSKRREEPESRHFQWRDDVVLPQSKWQNRIVPTINRVNSGSALPMKFNFFSKSETKPFFIREKRKHKDVKICETNPIHWTNNRPNILREISNRFMTLNDRISTSGNDDCCVYLGGIVRMGSTAIMYNPDIGYTINR
jgi:hypothetical protein